MRLVLSSRLSCSWFVWFELGNPLCVFWHANKVDYGRAFVMGNVRIFFANLKSDRFGGINLAPYHVDMLGGELVHMLNLVRHYKSVTTLGKEQGEQLGV